MIFVLPRTAVTAVFLSFTALSAFPQNVTGPVSRSAGTGLWTDVTEQTITTRLAIRGATQARDIVPLKYRALQLNKAGLTSLLASVVPETAGPIESSGVEFQIPRPPGGFHRFLIQESPVMEPELAKKFPELKTYVGRGLDDPTATLRMDVGPRGFHAIIVSAEGEIYIDPYSRDTDGDYIAYFKRDFVAADKNFTCELDRQVTNAVEVAAPLTTVRSSGGTLRTYRLAIACTGEYAAAVSSPGAPSVLTTLAAIITSVNRVTAIYERELAVRLTLVANNDKLIYLDGATDPYANTSGSTMLSQNQSNIDTIIGNANYDLGHVFSTGGGGIAGVGVVCVTGMKARGASGAPSPNGDPFDVDYVVHEMGHQFGAHHPFDGTGGYCSGNNSSSTAYEPGSGSTVMAYAGICSTQSLAAHSDDYFHTISYDEISNYISSVSPNCAQTSASGNTPPGIGTLPAFTIPAQTPFALTGIATDADGDALTYCWEEFDRGPLQDPTTDPRDNGSSPLFRSFPPTTSPVRFFPSLTYILNNQNLPPATVANYATGEFLPTTSRTMSFRLTVRDNRPVGAVAYGSTTVTSVSSAGPFAVTSPNTPLTIVGGAQQIITWKVANTDIAPISCANVKISLSTDGGNTFPIILAGSVPNNGSAAVTIPNTANVATTQGRIKVEAINNIFFDISDADLTILSTNAPPLLSITNYISVSRGKSLPTNSTVGTASDADGNPVTVAVSDVPFGAHISASINNGLIGLSATVDCGLVTTLNLRSYPIIITVTDSNGSTASAKANLVVTPNPAPTLGTYANIFVPANGTGNAIPSNPPADANSNLGVAPCSVSPTALPAGGSITINQSTGIVTVAPTSGTSLGVVPIQVKVTDSCGAVVFRTFNVQITPPIFPLLRAGLASDPATESCTPPNGAVDPGETVTINLPINNIGGAATSNLVATLQATGGITPITTSQTYGTILAQGNVTKPFQFTTAGTCGSTVTVTLALQDGVSGYGSVSYTIPLGSPIPVYAENFDGVTAPALPAGWTAVVSSGTPVPWTSTVSTADTAPNSVSAATSDSISDNLLVSPSLNIPASGAQLSFRHRWDLEEEYDGGILEISIDGGSFSDIIAAGGTFLAGGYNDTISVGSGSPIAGSAAWTGYMDDGYITTRVSLPAAALGKTARFRWRLTSDISFSDPSAGWHIDNVMLSGNSYSCVNCSSSPEITNGPPPPTVVAGAPYSFAFSANGNPAPVFSIRNGALPAGLSLSPAGVLSGVVNAGAGVSSNITVAADNGNPPEAQATFSLTTVTRADTWLSSFGLSGPNAALLYDYDRDGLSNLVEYGLGLNPTVAGVSGLPVVSIQKYGNSNYVSMTFSRSTAATDLTYTVQASSDLVTWTDLASSVGGGPASGPGFVQETGLPPNVSVEVHDTVAFESAPGGRRFIRLKISSP